MTCVQQDETANVLWLALNDTNREQLYSPVGQPEAGAVVEAGEGVVPLAWGGGGDPAVMAEGEGEVLVLVGVEPSIARTCINTSSQAYCCDNAPQYMCLKTAIACQLTLCECCRQLRVADNQ